MDTQTLIRLVIGLLMTAVVLVFAARRVVWLTNLIRSGQPTSDERGRTDHLGTRITTQIKEVFGQTRLLKWSIPGLAHFFTMWGFFILATVYIEAYGTLFSPTSTSRWSAGGTRWASCRTSSRSRCWRASPRSRSFGCVASPRSTAANPDSTDRTPAAPG